VPILFELLDHSIGLGHWLFTQLLLPALFAATDASSTHEKARVVTVSSSASYLTAGLDFDAMTDSPERTKYSEFELYNKSKFVRKNNTSNRPIY
jgi:retinol dehydrogenase-12